MKEIRLKIVTPEKVLLDDIVKQVSVSTTTGQITVLPNHLPLVSQLKPGEVIVKHNGDNESLMAISGGFVEVLPNQVVILADTAERAEDIDEAKAEQARQKAQELLESKGGDAKQFALFSSRIEKEMARIRVARKYKKRGHRTSLNQ